MPSEEIDRLKKRREEILTLLVCSILFAVVTVSPNKQYRGILIPAIPATTGPLWQPERASPVDKIVRSVRFTNSNFQLFVVRRIDHGDDRVQHVEGHVDNFCRMIASA